MGHYLLQKQWGWQDWATALLVVLSPVTGQGLTKKTKVPCLGDQRPFFAEAASKDPKISNLWPSRTHYNMLLFTFPPPQYQAPYRQPLCQQGIGEEDPGVTTRQQTQALQWRGGWEHPYGAGITGKQHGAMPTGFPLSTVEQLGV